MTDIVERLRSIDCSWSDEGELAAEAADHITHLGIELSQRAEDIHELHLELAASKANDLYAMRLLAESQAREKVLIEQRNAWKEIAEYRYGHSRLLQFEDVDYPVFGALDAWACGRHQILKIGTPTDDSTLTMLMAKEFSKGYTRGIGNYEDSLKIALAAERERCIENVMRFAMSVAT